MHSCVGQADSVERALRLHGTMVSAATPKDDDGASGGGAGEEAGGGRPIRVFRCSTNKSHARMAGEGEGGKGSGRQGKGQGKGGGAAGGGGERKGVGWQQRMRRRLHKKVEGRAAAHSKRGGKGGKGDGGTGAGAAIAKSITKAKNRKAMAASGGASKTPPMNAKARKVAKERALDKRARSKAAKAGKVREAHRAAAKGSGGKKSKAAHG